MSTDLNEVASMLHYETQGETDLESDNLIVPTMEGAGGGNSNAMSSRATFSTKKHLSKNSHLFVNNSAYTQSFV